MPSDQSTWLISAPLNGDTEGLFQEFSRKVAHQAKAVPPNNIAPLNIPTFKTGTLDTLISLSEDLPKQEAFFTATVAKTVDTLRNLVNNDATKLAQHTVVNEDTVDEYVLRDWKWNEGRYGLHRGLRETVDTLNKEMASIDNSMRTKLQNYNLVKGSLVQMQRKKTGNLSVKSLADIVRKEDFVEDSEYLETLVVAVPKNIVKDWNTSYERLTTMVVPRSSKTLATDDDYFLNTVVIFRKVHDEYVQKCRERKFLVRDFTYSEDEIHKQREEMETTDVTEKELWAELLQLSRTNFSEAFQLLVHIKVVRLFVESVLRYGLPANYTGLVVKPDTKSAKKLFELLQSQFSFLGSSSGRYAKDKGQEEFVGEFQALMEQDFYDFVIYEVPWIV
ncbi:ATPase, V1 complex, subunit C [Cylindrobasidium torrendii FP15055 ss-10]|uniref:V-type proton ATPase subunit C n=1 Tax=Cylindrobasidium torrendii FP15055 ss-10 TaxID=1314674 RepID=A0A0D7B0M5_9AGAR|nr:ATPase, V1 complex, subunit C [Cylindrobasidium torrendii FP15055 ss-10]